MCTTLETNLQVIVEQARQRYEENQQFRAFLREIASARLDALVAQLNAEIESQIDCTACGNCCRHFHATVHEQELPPLAAHAQCTTEAFKAKFLKPYKEVYYFATTPCPMLQPDNRCSIYAQRPQSCRTFPNLTGPHFKYRFHLVMEKYPLCPIVFNVVEKLKSVLGFQHASNATQNR